MRLHLWLVLLLMGLSTWSTAQHKTILEIGKNPVETDFASGGELRFDLCSSGVTIRGSENNKVRISYGGGKGDPSKVRIKFKSTGNRGELDISSCPHNNFQITIDVPSQTDLYLRQFAGQVDVVRVTGNKDIELHAGQLNVEVGKPEDYAHVEGSVNTGEVNAMAFNVSKGGLFRSFEKDGPGKYRLHAHVGAGELDLN
jgi:hypothetical protein